VIKKGIFQKGVRKVDINAQGVPTQESGEEGPMDDRLEKEKGVA